MEWQLLAVITAASLATLAPACAIDEKSEASGTAGPTSEETSTTTNAPTSSSTSEESATSADTSSSGADSTGWRDGIDCPAPLPRDQLPIAYVSTLFNSGDRTPPYLGECQAGPLVTEMTGEHPWPWLSLSCALEDGPAEFILEADNIEPIRSELEALQEYESLELFTLGGDFGLYDADGNIVLLRWSSSLFNTGDDRSVTERVVGPLTGWTLVGGSDSDWRTPFGPLYGRDLGCAERVSMRDSKISEIPWALEFESDLGSETLYDATSELVTVSGTDYRVFVTGAYVATPEPVAVPESGDDELSFMISRLAAPPG